jgi:hypothetical protein
MKRIIIWIVQHPSFEGENVVDWLAVIGNGKPMRGSLRRSQSERSVNWMAFSRIETPAFLLAQVEFSRQTSS